MYEMLFLYPKSSTELLISMFTRAFKATVQSGGKMIHKLLPTGMITSYLLSSDLPTPFPPAAALGQSCDMQVQFGYSAYYMLMNYSVDFSACEYKIRTMETVCHMLTWFLLRKTGQVDKTWVSPIHWG